MDKLLNAWRLVFFGTHWQLVEYSQGNMRDIATPYPEVLPNWILKRKMQGERKLE
jgi:hypothetical protein